MKVEKNIKKSIYKVAKQGDPLVYCGPDLKGIRSGTTFLNGSIEKTILAKHMDNCKAVNSLIAPVKEFVETKKKIETEGSAENVFYKRILNYAKGGENSGV